MSETERFKDSLEREMATESEEAGCEESVGESKQTSIEEAETEIETGRELSETEEIEAEEIEGEAMERAVNSGWDAR